MTLSDVDASRPLARRNPDRAIPQATGKHAGSVKQSVAPLLFSAAVIAALVFGWLRRDDGHLTPENGTGYWLGVVGGVAMLLLLLYPLRKRYRLLRVLGSIPSWFRLHMLLGILGPVLILFHANFKLGSANSNVALFSMLLVAGSGIIGRYLYGKIHLGLYGRKSDVAECLADAQAFMTELSEQLPASGGIVNAMTQFGTMALAPKPGVISGSWHLIVLHWKARRCQRQLMREARTLVANEGKARGWSWSTRRRNAAAVRDRLNRFFRAVRRAAAFAVYERLFALWHVLHLPLFFLLVLTATLHVIAVHIY